MPCPARSEYAPFYETYVSLVPEERSCERCSPSLSERSIS